MDKIFIRHEGSDTRPTPKYAGVTSHKQFWALWKKWRREHYSRPVTYWKELYEVDSDGNMGLVNRFEWVRPAKPEKIDDVQIGYKDLGETTRQYLTATSPVIGWPVWGWYYRNWEKLSNSRASIDEFIREILWRYLPDNLWVNVVFSLLMVCLAFWHGWSRRRGLVRLGFWLVFVGTFNLAGLLTYLALNHTTVIRCGVCGKKRGLERTDCAECKAELVMPKGRETDLILLGAFK